LVFNPGVGNGFCSQQVFGPKMTDGSSSNLSGRKSMGCFCGMQRYERGDYRMTLATIHFFIVVVIALLLATSTTSAFTTTTTTTTTSTITVPLIPHHVQKARRGLSSSSSSLSNDAPRRRQEAQQVGALYHGVRTSHLRVFSL
jgi:hypothetical protein